MPSPLTKLAQRVEETDSEFPVRTLFTRILIQALCPMFRSEVLFGDLQPVEQGQSFSFWTEDVLEGDIIGRLAVGAEQSTLRTLAAGLAVEKNGKPDLEGALTLIQHALSESMRGQFAREDFRCTIRSGGSPQKNHVWEREPGSHFHCPVETKFGIFHVVFSLEADSASLREEFSASLRIIESRKIRVFASQLDRLYEDVRLIEDLETKLGSGPAARDEMRAQIKRVKRLVHHLKSEPLELLFSPARKLATEIAEQQGKAISISSQGTWLFLDKTVLNRLYEPMLLLIRNVVEHGIEAPSERERLGKPPEGKIKCIATFGVKGLRMIVSDDGQGLDYAKIRACAVASKLLSSEQAEQRLPEQLWSLVFNPGHGLEAVKSGIDVVGGTIRVLSTSKQGTSFEICIPLNEELLLTTRPT